MSTDVSTRTAWHDKKCQTCDGPFKSSRSDALFCSPRCRKYFNNHREPYPAVLEMRRGVPHMRLTDAEVTEMSQQRNPRSVIRKMVDGMIDSAVLKSSLPIGSTVTDITIAESVNKKSRKARSKKPATKKPKGKKRGRSQAKK